MKECYGLHCVCSLVAFYVTFLWAKLLRNVGQFFLLYRRNIEPPNALSQAILRSRWVIAVGAGRRYFSRIPATKQDKSDNARNYC